MRKIAYNLIIVLIISCTKTEPELVNAMSLLKNSMTQDEIKSFALTPESTAPYFFSKNQKSKFENSILVNDSNIYIMSFFTSLGVIKANDITRVIIISLHRQLNNLPIQLADQINEIELRKDNYDNRMLACGAEAQNQLDSLARIYKSGDTLHVGVYLDSLISSNNGIICPCPDNFEFIEQRDLLLTGKVVKFSNFQDGGQPSVFLQLLDVNRTNVLFMMHNIVIGDTLNIPINGVKIW